MLVVFSANCVQMNKKETFFLSAQTYFVNEGGGGGGGGHPLEYICLFVFTENVKRSGILCFSYVCMILILQAPVRIIRYRPDDFVLDW